MPVSEQTANRVEIHQLEAFDPEGRSFNRNVEIHRVENGFLAQFQYEGVKVNSGIFLTIRDAVADLAQRLHQKGFRNVRTRVNFKGKRYLAERQPWIDYPDPPN